ncbi:MAG: hypothetical protein ACK5QX_08260 [bacterium]|jgi:transposase
MICAQTRVAGVSLSQVARRDDANTNLVFTWLRDPRFAQAGPDEDQAHFLSVEVIDGAGDEVPFALVLRSIGRVVTGCGSSAAMIPRLSPG